LDGTNKAGNPPLVEPPFLVPTVVYMVSIKHRKPLVIQSESIGLRFKSRASHFFILSFDELSENAREKIALYIRKARFPLVKKTQLCSMG